MWSGKEETPFNGGCDGLSSIHLDYFRCNNLRLRTQFVLITISSSDKLYNNAIKYATEQKPSGKYESKALNYQVFIYFFK